MHPSISEWTLTNQWPLNWSFHLLLNIVFDVARSQTMRRPSPPPPTFQPFSLAAISTRVLLCGGEPMTAAFYWWECLWIFEGPFNLAWEETGNERPLWVAFTLPQHNMLLFLEALYNSYVNPPLWRNVSVTQRPSGHTHNNGVIHIAALSSFLPSIYLIWMISKKSDKDGHSGRRLHPELLLRWLIVQQMASFCVSVHMRLCAF